MIIIIAAIDKNRVLGKGNTIPWHLPADFAHFKETTAGHPVIMGLNTYRSIGRPLPERTNIVLSKDDEKIEGCLVAHSLLEAFDLAKERSEDIFVIGGASVYEQALPFADVLNLTLIDAEVEGDIFFPKFNLNEWKEISHEEKKADEKNIYNMSFVKYVRR
jgi:dihydrofolate reductase